MSKETLISWLGATLIRVYALTLRVRITDEADMPVEANDPPVIVVFWHNRIMLIPLLYRRYRPRRRGVVLTSASRDGGLLAEFARRFGLEAARGSSSRRGAQAMLRLNKLVQDAHDVGITPDGPRGPRYKVGPGVVHLAQKTRAPIVTLSVNYSSWWSLRSWDRFMIPKPFARVDVTWGRRISIPDNLDDIAFEQRRLELENLLNDARNDRD